MDTERLKERVRESDVLPVVLIGLVLLSPIATSIVIADLSGTTEWSDGSYDGAPAIDETDRLAFYQPGDTATIRITYLDNGTQKTDVSLPGKPESAEYIENRGSLLVGTQNGKVASVLDDGTVEWTATVGTNGQSVQVAGDTSNVTVWTVASDRGSGTDSPTITELDAAGNELNNFTSTGEANDLEYDSDTDRVYWAANGAFRYINDSYNVVSVSGANAEAVEVTDDRVVMLDSGGTVTAYDKSLNSVWSRSDGKTFERPLGAEDQTNMVFYDNTSGVVAVNATGGVVGTLSSETMAGEGEVFDDGGNVSLLRHNDNGAGNNVAYIQTDASDSPTVDGGGGGGGVLNESLEIDTRHYLPHNTTTPFRVYYTKNNTTTINVTSNATVTVRDPEVLSVDQTAGTMSSTNNTSINKVTYVNASYAGANASKEVVVANETVENIDILPPLQKWTATIGDDNSLVIVIATAISAGVALIASSLAGVAAFPIVITGAWVAGYVATHTLLAAILMSIFIGLNVAQVVEYSG